MFMSKLRGTKKNNRIWWILVVVVLGFSLVGSYAVWTGGGNIPTSGTQSTPNNVVDQKAVAEQTIKDSKASILAIETRLKTSKDPKEIGSLNLALGNYHYYMAQIYSFQLNKPTEGATEFKGATDAYNLATQYDPKNADLRTDYATAAMYSGQNELAQAQFEEAIKIDAKHLNSRLNYSVFLFQALKKYPEALAQVAVAQQLAKGNAEAEARASQLLTAIQTEASKPATTTESTYSNTTTQSTYGK
jgi:tetratricopeptide (TPR) repeat protein